MKKSIYDQVYDPAAERLIELIFEEVERKSGNLCGAIRVDCNPENFPLSYVEDKIVNELGFASARVSPSVYNNTIKFDIKRIDK